MVTRSGSAVRIVPNLIMMTSRIIIWSGIEIDMEIRVFLGYVLLPSGVGESNLDLDLCRRNVYVPRQKSPKLLNLFILRSGPLSHSANIYDTTTAMIVICHFERGWRATRPLQGWYVTCEEFNTAYERYVFRKEKII